LVDDLVDLGLSDARHKQVSSVPAVGQTPPDHHQLESGPLLRRPVLEVVLDLTVVDLRLDARWRPLVGERDPAIRAFLEAREVLGTAVRAPQPARVQRWHPTRGPSDR